MNQITEQKIIQLNKSFYDNISKHWNHNPSYYWQGWYKLLPYLQKKIGLTGSIKILDLGCGNGRFLSFLHFHFPDIQVDYTGVDNSDFSKIDISLYNSIKVKFINQDLLQKDWNLNDKYDIVVAFGIIHHIPGERLLYTFFDNLASSLADNGLIIFTTWQYMRLERLRKRVLIGEKKLQLTKELCIDEKELRPGDNFLDWTMGDYGVRFSHYFEEREVCEIIDSYRLNLLDNYLDDDREQNRNQYFIVKKPTSRIS